MLRDEILLEAERLDETSELDRSTVWIATFIVQIKLLECFKTTETQLTAINGKLDALLGSVKGGR